MLVGICKSYVNHKLQLVPLTIEDIVIGLKSGSDHDARNSQHTHEHSFQRKYVVSLPQHEPTCVIFLSLTRCVLEDHSN
jgi:hypothetical protein